MDHSLLGIAKKQRDINLEDGDFSLLKTRKENFMDSSTQIQKLYKEPKSPGSSCNKPLFISSLYLHTISRFRLALSSHTEQQRSLCDRALIKWP